MVRRAARRRPPVPCEPFVTPADRRRQRFFLEPNNFVYGGIRLNLAGREPAGCVAPHEAAAVIAALRDDLLALINVDTGAPAIDAVEPADRWYTESRIEAMPDVFVDWRRTGPIDTVWSPKVGLVHAPYANWRTGDHRPDGLLLVTGPGVRGGTEFSPVDMTDLAPTLLATVGVTAPDLDGRPRPSLVGL
jgi:predicted AlkP superfamily phosphohydrolase/phosphomutase